MRTDMLKLPTLLAAAVLLAGLPPTASAQQEAGEAAAALEETRREIDAQHERMAREAEETGREAAEPRQGVAVRTGDQVVKRGEVVEGDMVVVGGDLLVEGEIRGNAVVTGGSLTLVDGARVSGDAVVTGGEIHSDGGRVLGEMRTLEGGSDRPRQAAAARAPEPPAPPRSPRTYTWYDRVADGIGNIVSILALGAVLALIGAGLVFYGLPYVRTVSETLRKNTARSAATGLAATFLIIPAFVLLIVALAVTIVGIPLLVVAVPLYPLLVVLAYGFGLVAAAHAIGEHTVEQRGDFTFRHRNAYAYVFYGIAILLAPLLLAMVVGMMGFLEWLAALLVVVSVVGLWIVSTMGLGAVILSRGGTRRTFARDVQPVLDDDPLFDSEPVVR